MVVLVSCYPSVVSLVIVFVTLSRQLHTLQTGVSPCRGSIQRNLQENRIKVRELELFQLGKLATGHRTFVSLAVKH